MDDPYPLLFERFGDLVADRHHALTSVGRARVEVVVVVPAVLVEIALAGVSMIDQHLHGAVVHERERQLG